MTRSLSGHKPKAQQRRQELLVERIRQKYQRRISREIARAMRKAGRLYAEGRLISVDAILVTHRPRIERLLKALWSDSISSMQTELLDNAKSMGFIERKSDVPTTPNADLIMQQWIVTVGAQKITRVTSTTVRDIQRVINTGISEGLGELDIAERIFAIAPTKSASRAQTIARTETHSATSATAQATAQASGLPFKKEWVSSQGERTRSLEDGAEYDHVIMDGVQVGMNETFKVPHKNGGHDEVLFPGDPMGAPANIINCRCVCTYVL
jgi:hypothetical protein